MYVVHTLTRPSCDVRCSLNCTGKGTSPIASYCLQFTSVNLKANTYGKWMFTMMMLHGICVCVCVCVCVRVCACVRACVHACVCVAG